MRPALPDDLWEEQLLPHTRIHSIPMPVLQGGQVFLKREDEAGYAVAGGKMRKFASLIPHWKKAGIKKVFVIGGSQSNQVLAASQILRQEGIDFQLVVKEGHFEGPGNAFLTELLVPSAEWVQVNSAHWPQVEKIASEMADAADVPAFVLPEGAWCPEALPGTFSLARDIAHQVLPRTFPQAPGFNRQGIQTLTPLPDHIFIEAGTALSAIGLLMALPVYFEPAQLPEVHILLMAMDQAEFEERLKEAAGWVKQGLAGRGLASGIGPVLDLDLNPLPSYLLHIPSNAKSFGSVNRTVLDSILLVARKYGVLTDPVYSGKLFYETERIVNSAGIGGNILVIHSGGQSSLPGFYDKMKGLL